MLTNFLLGVSLKKILDMINALQMIILLALIKSNIPANAHMFFVRLTNIAAFDFADSGEAIFGPDFPEFDDMINYSLDLPPSEPYNQNFEASRIESIYFINNLGSFYFILMVYFLLYLVLVVIMI